MESALDNWQSPSKTFLRNEGALGNLSIDTEEIYTGQTEGNSGDLMTANFVDLIYKIKNSCMCVHICIHLLFYLISYAQDVHLKK